MNLEDNILLDRYLSGKMSKKERDAFEQRMADDNAFKSEVNLEIELRNSLNEKSWNFIDKPDTDEVEVYTALLKDDKTKRLKESIIQARLQYQSTKSGIIKKWVIIVAVACIILLWVMNSIFSTVKTGEELYATYYDETELPSLLVRSNNDTFNIAQIQLAFESKKYTETIHKISDELLEKSNDKSTLLLYKGISLMETNNTEEAKEIFNFLINSSLIDAEKGHWFLALLYLKTENKVMARKTFQNIVFLKTYNHQKATEILEIL